MEAAGVPSEIQDDVLDANANSRIEGLQAALAVLQGLPSSRCSSPA